MIHNIKLKFVKWGCDSAGMLVKDIGNFVVLHTYNNEVRHCFGVYKNRDEAERAMRRIKRNKSKYEDMVLTKKSFDALWLWRLNDE